MNFRIETEIEQDGRWIAEVPDLPGAMVYAPSQQEAVTQVKAVALRILAGRLENGELVPEVTDVFSVMQ